MLNLKNWYNPLAKRCISHLRMTNVFGVAKTFNAGKSFQLYDKAKIRQGKLSPGACAVI